jgi:excinuclease ABC subunit C
VTFHRLRRGKRQTETALDEIPGVGPKTVQKLLREFGSVANLKKAGIEKLSKVVSSKAAEKILTHLETSPAPDNRYEE